MTDEARPNPDALLSSIQRQEAAQQRGRLKAFLGMCPGLGKTYAILITESGVGYRLRPFPETGD